MCYIFIHEILSYDLLHHRHRYVSLSLLKLAFLNFSKAKRASRILLSFSISPYVFLFFSSRCSSGSNTASHPNSVFPLALTILPFVLRRTARRLRSSRCNTRICTARTPSCLHTPLTCYLTHPNPFSLRTISRTAPVILSAR